MGLVIEYSLEARTVRLLRQKLDYVRSCGVGTLDLNDELSRTACPGYLDREPAPQIRDYPGRERLEEGGLGIPRVGAGLILTLLGEFVPLDLPGPG